MCILLFFAADNQVIYLSELAEMHISSQLWAFTRHCKSACVHLISEKGQAISEAVMV